MSQQMRNLNHTMTRPDFMAVKDNISRVLEPLGFDMSLPIKEERIAPSVIRDMNKDPFVRFTQAMPVERAKEIKLAASAKQERLHRNALEVDILKSCKYLDTKKLEELHSTLVKIMVKSREESDKKAAEARDAIRKNAADSLKAGKKDSDKE